MSLRITGSASPVAPVVPVRTTGSVSRASAVGVRASVGPAAELDVTVRARQALQQLPNVREDRIAAARQRLSAGTYSVKADDHALRILSQ